MRKFLTFLAAAFVLSGEAQAQSSDAMGNISIQPLTTLSCLVNVADANISVSSSSKLQKLENGVAIVAIQNTYMKGFEYRAVYDVNSHKVDLSIADLRSQSAGSVVQASFSYPKSDLGEDFRTVHAIVVKKKNPAKKNRKESVQRVAVFSCDIAE